MTVAIRIRDYSQLTQALAARRRQLGLRQLDADEKASLQPEYFGKIECHDRCLGPLSLPMALAALEPLKLNTNIPERFGYYSAGITNVNVDFIAHIEHGDPPRCQMSERTARCRPESRETRL